MFFIVAHNVGFMSNRLSHVFWFFECSSFVCFFFLWYIFDEIGGAMCVYFFNSIMIRSLCVIWNCKCVIFFYSVTNDRKEHELLIPVAAKFCARVQLTTKSYLNQTSNGVTKYDRRSREKPTTITTLPLIHLYPKKETLLLFVSYFTKTIM